MYIILITISTFQNPVSEIKKIASFLGKECSNTFAEEVAEKCNIENVRKAEEQIRNNEHAFVYRKGYYQSIKKYFTFQLRNNFYGCIYTILQLHRIKI